MIRPAITFATAEEIRQLMRPLYETKRDFDQSDTCVQCDGEALQGRMICRLCRGTGWRVRWTERVVEEQPRKAASKGHVKFSPEVVAVIRKHRHQPMKHVASIAAKYGMSYSQARRIIRGENRR